MAMSDSAQGPGWWLASDGRWYPPEQAPGYEPQPETPAASPLSAPVVGPDMPPPGWWQGADGQWYPPQSQQAASPSRPVEREQPPPGWWQASDGNWHPPEQHPDRRNQPEQRRDVLVPSAADIAAWTEYEHPSQSDFPLNELYAVSYRGGWIGLFAGESQVKALHRALPEINVAGRRVVAAVEDRWSFWKRFGVALLFLVTLGFVGRVPNVLLITEPVPRQQAEGP